MRLENLLIILALAALPGIAAAAQVFQNGPLQIEGTWARMAPNQAGSVSVFFEVLNLGDEADMLVSASSPVADKATLQRGKWRGFDFFKKSTDGIKIRANGRASFRPGALKITLKDFKVPVGVRSTVPIMLVFEQGGTMDIEATVSNQLLGNRINK